MTAKVAGYSQQAAHPSGRLAKASTFKLTLVKALPRNQTLKGVESFWFGPFFFHYQAMTAKVAGYSQQAAHPSGRLAKASTFKLTLVKALPRNQTLKGVESFWFGPFFFAYVRFVS